VRTSATFVGGKLVERPDDRAPIGSRPKAVICRSSLRVVRDAVETAAHGAASVAADDEVGDHVGP